MKEKIKKTFKWSLIATAIVVLVAGITIVSYKWYEDTHKKDYSYEVYRSRVELYMEGTHNSIVTEIDKYIDSVAPGSNLNGIILFQLCDEYKIDVRFAMAQAELESHFGTAGVAAKTNSVWNVKAYDGRSASDMNNKGDGFSHPDQSIEPYLQLLTKSYITNGKTEEDMFIKFVTIKGARYASNPNYEVQLLNIYNRINENTSLDTLINEYKKYKMILGR